MTDEKGNDQTREGPIMAQMRAAVAGLRRHAANDRKVAVEFRVRAADMVQQAERREQSAYDREAAADLMEAKLFPNQGRSPA